MRCFFMRTGHIAGVKELPGLSDEEAVALSRELFNACRAKFAYDGFEVWQLSRMVTQYSLAEACKAAGDALPSASKRSTWLGFVLAPTSLAPLAAST
jgi:hypothetical protein